MFIFFLAIVTIILIAYLWALGNVLKERRRIWKRHAVEEDYFDGRALPPHHHHHEGDDHGHGHDDHDHH